MAARDRFPTTYRTWIEEQLDRGGAGAADANRHIMSVYAGPLEVFARGTPYARMAAPQELVASFFADRLARGDFLAAWLASGKRLRHWLCNALVFHLKELARRQWRRSREVAGEELDSLPADGEAPYAAVDRAFAVAVVQSALAATKEHLGERRMGEHFRAFERHHAEGLSYREVARELDLPPERVRVMARAGRDAFRRSVREHLRRDGARSIDLDAEVEVLLESLR